MNILLTNLNKNSYYDEKKEIYKKSWSVEIFFKLLKYNFKFEYLVEHNKIMNYDKYKKLCLVNLIIIYLAKIIEKLIILIILKETIQNIKKENL